MFTGIIEQTGTLISLENRGGVRRITVEAPGLAGQLREGDSLGVSGVCLTALDVNPTLFHADLAQETLDCTSLGALTPGAKVNLELPTAAGSPLGGHIVQGHVDGCGGSTALEPVISRQIRHSTARPPTGRSRSRFLRRCARGWCIKARWPSRASA